MNRTSEHSPESGRTPARDGAGQLERLNALLSLTAALSEALTPTDVAEIIVSRGVATLGATAGSVSLLTPELDALEVVASIGYPEEMIYAWRRFPMTSAVPLADVVRTGTPIFMEGREQMIRRYPDLASRLERSSDVLAAIPLIADGAPIGAIGLNFPLGHTIAEEDREFMMALARQCTMALERSRLYDAELRERRRAEDAEKRLWFLVRAGERLAASLDTETTLKTITEIEIPEQADGCAIYLRRSDGSIEWNAIAHVDPAKEKLMWSIAERYVSIDGAIGGIESVISSGTGVNIPNLTPEMLAGHAIDDEHRETLMAIAPASLMIVPLEGRGEMIGAMILVNQEERRRFSAEDFTMAVDLSRRAALAIDSSMRFSALRQEIAERLRVEHALGESELRYRTIFEQAPLGIQTFAPDGTMRGANRAWEELWGASREQAAGYNILEDSQLEAKGQMEAIRRAFRGERVVLPPVAYDPAENGRPGRPRWVRALFYPVTGEEGIQEMVLLLEDVTERIESEEKLKLSEERFRALVETAPDVIYSLSAYDATITALNPAFEVLTGWKREEWIGRQFHPLVHPDDLELAVELFIRVIGGETPPPRELRILTIDGEYRTGEFRSRPRFEEGAVVESLGIARDVTGRKETEEELIAAKNVAEAASRAKDQFLATLSHELRTPLTPVLAAVQALEEGCTAEEMAPLLEIIRRNIELEAHLIDDMLDLTRISRGKIQLDLRPIDPHRLIGHVMEICSSAIETKQLRINMRLDAGDLRVTADPSRLQQVFWNLVQNAVKFTPVGGEITVRSRMVDRWWRLEIADSGIGIPPDVLPHIFNAFEQGDVTITRQFGGLGLGLAISKALIDAHGGRLIAESEGIGKGAVFSVELGEESRGRGV